MTGSISHQDLSDLIGRIYDCALDPSRWEPTLDAIKTRLQCPTAQLGLVDLLQHRILLSKDLGMDARMHEQVSRHAPEIVRLLEEPLDNGHSMDEPLVTSRQYSPAYVAASPYFQTAYSRGFVDFAQMVLMRTPTRLSVLGFGRQESVGAFGDAEIEIV